MIDGAERTIAVEGHEVRVTRRQFRDALLQSHRTRGMIDELDAAAAHFCKALRRTHHTPEGMLIEAKRVIQGAIDDDDRPMADKALSSCILHYFRE